MVTKIQTHTLVWLAGALGGALLVARGATAVHQFGHSLRERGGLPEAPALIVTVPPAICPDAASVAQCQP